MNIILICLSTIMYGVDIEKVDVLDGAKTCNVYSGFLKWKKDE